jgi:hypothetical protein
MTPEARNAARLAARFALREGAHPVDAAMHAAEEAVKTTLDQAEALFKGDSAIAYGVNAGEYPFKVISKWRKESQ